MNALKLKIGQELTKDEMKKVNGGEMQLTCLCDSGSGGFSPHPSLNTDVEALEALADEYCGEGSTITCHNV
ncbi:bacteriocin-type signal sequence-containing protein [Parapedobacter luteus]|uniref:Bacteriocin-type signal sequence-containing protein n=1 Tax=Parapedobacter luteus TaxID=623280 RepID=A0A1T4ZV58_9SPHI|nr:hypothetical protein [Parapedobacter luteus]SKB26568.1 bacteriocin-type signal sequence-containing protein [Parapedobacter luteus]